MERVYTKVLSHFNEAYKKNSDPEKKNSEDSSWHDILSNRNDANKQAEKYVVRSRNGYMFDGLIRQAVDVYAESYNGITLTGPNAELVKKLRSRLDIISLSGDEHWETTVNRYIHEMWRTGTALILKIRGNTPLAKRALWADAPYAIVGFKLLSILEYAPVYTKIAKRLVWKRLDGKEVNPVQRGPNQKLDNNLIASMNYDKAKNELRNHVDVVPLYYKQIPGVDYGWGLSWPSLEDVVSLRSFERATMVMAKKFMNPLIHHKINRALMPGQDIDRDINRARHAYINRGPDGVLFTGPNDEITVHGSESQAMRTEGLMSHFSNRGFAGLSVTPFMMGFADGSNGGAEASKLLTNNKRTFNLNEIGRTIEFYILWELLYEMGYNPYENEDDRVYVVFNDIDQDVQIKRQNHYVDLWIKGAIDFDEMREQARMFGVFNDSKSYLNMIDKKKSEFKQTPGPKASNSKEGPKNSVDLNSFEDYLLAVHEIDPTTPEQEEKLRALYEADQEAALVYLKHLKGN